jgi:uncharacterized membrane protein YsdA (DUF1294 family)
VFAVAVAVIFLTAVAALAVRGVVPVVIPAMYLIASVVTGIVYRIDKAAAQRGAWRTPETTLHALGLIGGWPGAFVAQTLFHHKSRKPTFRVIFWVTVALNCGALFWLCAG